MLKNKLFGLLLIISCIISFSANANSRKDLDEFFHQSIPNVSLSKSLISHYKERGYDFERFLFEAFTDKLSLDKKTNENAAALSKLGHFLTQNRDIEFSSAYVSKFSTYLLENKSKYSNKGFTIRRVLILEIKSHVSGTKT